MIRTNRKTSDSQQPCLVGIQIGYKVREGAEEAFDHWLQEMSWHEMNAAGNAGVAIERKVLSSGLECHVESRFRNHKSLDRWLNSEQRHYCLAKLPPMTSEPPRIKHIVEWTSEGPQIPSSESLSWVPLVINLSIAVLVMLLHISLLYWLATPLPVELPTLLLLMIPAIAMIHFVLLPIEQALVKSAVRCVWAYHRKYTNAMT